MLVGSSKSTSFQHQSRDRKLALGKLPCYFFWCSDLLSLIVGLGWVVLNFRCSFFQKQRLYFFWFNGDFPPTNTNIPAVNLGPRCSGYCLNGRNLGVAFRLPAWLADVPLFPAICGREDWQVSGRKKHTNS